MATRKSKSKRITVKPAGISIMYVDCPSCLKLRPHATDEICLVAEGETHCRYCKGILWAREWAKKHGKNSRKRFGAPVAKAKVNRRIEG